LPQARLVQGTSRAIVNADHLNVTATPDSHGSYSFSNDANSMREAGARRSPEVGGSTEVEPANRRGLRRW